MSGKVVTLLESEPEKKLLSLIPSLVDPITGQYNFPPHSFFEGISKVREQGFKGSGEIVAIIDTGMDHDHPLLKGSIIDAQDFTQEGTPQDLHGHGTIVALLILYVAPQAKLLNAKALGEDGSGEKAALAAAMDWARRRHATVVNISSGVPAEDPLNKYPDFLRLHFANKKRSHWLLFFLRGHRFQRCAICEGAAQLIRSGTMVCSAVGNRKELVFCPGRGNRAVLAVGSAKIEGQRPAVARYSAYWPDLVAPELPLSEGTSFSAPFVSGVFCLLHELIETRDRPVRLVRLNYLTSRSNFLFDKGYFSDAIALYLKALTRDSHSVKHDAGGKSLENCLYCKSYVYPVRTRLGLAYLATGEPHLAQEQFSTNVKIAPTFPDAHMNLGAAYRNQGKHDAAVQEYHTALTLGAKPEAHEGLGDTLFLMGDLDQAINAFEESVKLDPTRTYSYQRLVQLCWQQGLTQKAEYYFRKMVSVGKHDM
jgi:hypothetical protein